MSELEQNDTSTATGGVPAMASMALTVDASEGAALLGIGRSTFLKQFSSGRIPAPLRFGRVVRWRKQELVDWLNAGCPSREKWNWKFRS